LKKISMEHLLPLYREKKAITIERKAILCNERKARQRRSPLYSYMKAFTTYV